MQNRARAAADYDRSRPVEREKLLACLEAARLAPSACNAQPYHFTLVTGKQAEAVGNCTRSLGMNAFTESVPAFVVISEEPYNLTAVLAQKLRDRTTARWISALQRPTLPRRPPRRDWPPVSSAGFEEKKLQTLFTLAPSCAPGDCGWLCGARGPTAPPKSAKQWRS